MGDLCHEVGDSGGGVDFKTLQTSIEIGELGWVDVPAEDLLALRCCDQIRAWWRFWSGAESHGKIIELLLA
ncbi:MAG: hypothetical protein ACKOZT_14380 [Cyanobium sp.]